MDKVKIEQVPEGQVVNREWLKDKGIDGPLVDYYVRSGYLENVTRGAYRRPGDPLKWQHLVYSLQVLGFNVHVGGQSALEMQGSAHYLPVGPKPAIHLFSEVKLPEWVFKTNTPVEFFEHSRTLFKDQTKNLGITTIPFGSWDWQINVASQERGFLEMIADVPNKISFHMVDVMMEGAMTLRPDIVSRLLEECKNIKVKRLFLWFAQKHNHQWFRRLKLSNVNLGKGKRVVEKDGKFDPKYLITVPRGSNDRQEQPVF